MPETDATASEKVYASPPSEPDDDFWLEQGGRMLAESLTTVRTAASALVSALGVLQGIYLGLLGFAKFLHETLPWWHKALFILPLVLWLFGLYYCLDVVMTKRLSIYLRSPSDIRAKSTELLLEKQGRLERAFWCLTLGLLTAFVLLLFGLRMGVG
jgi:hypothetical protein